MELFCAKMLINCLLKKKGCIILTLFFLINFTTLIQTVLFVERLESHKDNEKQFYKILYFLCSTDHFTTIAKRFNPSTILLLSPRTKTAYLISHVMVTVTLTLSSPRSITVASLGAEESFAIPLYIGG